MTESLLEAAPDAVETQSIIIDEVFPHRPEVLWQALTNGALINRWMMQPQGFEAVVGKEFTFQTTPAGAWDGAIRCTMLEVVPLQRLVYAWRSGDKGNVGYGAPLDTVVTFTLTPVEIGTRLKLVHAGFVLPRNDTAFTSMGKGWKTCVERLAGVVDKPD